MSKSVICVDKLAKSFGSHQVLREVSLNIPEGQTFALLGRNGAGKTTMIRIMLGLIPADSGTVLLAGLDPAVAPVKLRAQVGYLAEDQIMYGWMTPIELCRFLAPFYPTWDMDFARSYLERFDIPLHSKIRQLSKGQSIKLGLAVALAHRPPIVILDDPAMGLDPIARKEFNRDLVEHLQTSGCTVLYSSHLLGEVEAVADAVAILDQGRILRIGTTDQLREEVKRIILPIAAASGIP
jgi:ABC-2 type transport system ATP-binding protein